MARREFSRSVYAEIVHRASASGVVACEGCGFVLGKKPYHIDHTIPDALFHDKKRKLTADDGKLLGVECCHAPKTKQDLADIAEAKRREAKYLGITRPTQKIPARPSAKSEKAAKRQAKPSLPPRPLYEERAP